MLLADDNMSPTREVLVLLLLKWLKAATAG